jgi:hypothetical protein
LLQDCQDSQIGGVQLHAMPGMMKFAAFYAVAVRNRASFEILFCWPVSTVSPLE